MWEKRRIKIEKWRVMIPFCVLGSG
uniref:Uncharacterized protein n=1 Tax=Rhizophora mucronata TaxID=61149 RepID=A0A2P2PZT1_RHIMU